MLRHVGPGPECFQWQQSKPSQTSTRLPLLGRTSSPREMLEGLLSSMQVGLLCIYSTGNPYGSTKKWLLNFIHFAFHVCTHFCITIIDVPQHGLNSDDLAQRLQVEVKAVYLKGIRWFIALIYFILHWTLASRLVNRVKGTLVSRLLYVLTLRRKSSPLVT